MPYPVGSDVAAFLIAAGVIDSAPTGDDADRYDEFATAASEDFERDSDWRPFLESAEMARVYRPPDAGVRFLDLGAGLLELAAANAVVADGTTLTEGHEGDYVMMPKSARPETLATAVEGYPYQYIEFIVDVSAYDEIVITAKFGVYRTLPAQVKWAIIKKAAAELATMEQGGGGVVAEKQADVEFRYDKAHTLVASWMADYEKTVTRFQRIEVI